MLCAGFAQSLHQSTLLGERHLSVHAIKKPERKLEVPVIAQRNLHRLSEPIRSGPGTQGGTLYVGCQHAPREILGKDPGKISDCLENTHCCMEL